MLFYRSIALNASAIVAMVAMSFASPVEAETLSREALLQLKQATAFIKIEGPGYESSGSGFLLSKSDGVGYFVTNSHVLSDQGKVATKISVVLNSGTSTEKSLPAEVVGDDASADLAVLRVRASDLPDAIASDSSPEVYETLDVLILGFPFGGALAAGGKNPAITIAKGTVSSIRRSKFNQIAAVQIDGSINPGNSGGPIVTSDGKLVGIAVAKLSNTQIGFAIPAETLRRMLLGRASGVSFQRREGDQVGVQVDVVDPLKRLSRCAIIVGPKTKESEELRPNASGVWKRLPGAKTYELKKAADGQFEGAIKVSETDWAKLLFQIAVIPKGDAVTFTEPGEFFVAPDPEASLASESSSSTGRQNSSRTAGENWLGGRSPNEQEGGPERQSGSLAEVPIQIGDIRMSPLLVEAESLVPYLVWSDDGRYLYCLTKNGLLQKLSVPDFVETNRLELNSACSFLGMSTAGLVVVTDSVQKVVTIDPKELVVEKTIPVAGVKTVACAAPSHQGFVATGSSLVALDLRRGRVTGSTEVRMMKGDPRRVKRTTTYVPGTGLEMLTMTPDGKYLFSKGGTEMLQRIRVSGNTLSVEEFSPRIGQNSQSIAISPDSKYVAMPSGGGNYKADGHPDLNYGTYIYSVANLQSPAIGVSTGAYPRAIGFDHTAGKIFAQNRTHQLIIINAGGVKEAEYELSPKGGDVQLFSVHPKGGRLCVLTEKELLWVDLTQDSSSR